MEIQIKCEADEMWDSGIEAFMKPAYEKAIDVFGEQVLETDDWFSVDIGPYKIKMRKSLIINYNIFAPLEYGIEVEVGVSTETRMRWFVGIFYKKVDGEWVTDKDEGPKNSFVLTKGNEEDGD